MSRNYTAEERNAKGWAPQIAEFVTCKCGMGGKLEYDVESNCNNPNCEPGTVIRKFTCTLCLEKQRIKAETTEE